MNTEYTDEELLQMIRESEQTRDLAFAYLFQWKDLQHMAFSKITGMVSDVERGKDIYLDSILAFIKNVRHNKFKGESKITTYIVRICHFQCLRYLDKQKKERERADTFNQEQSQQSDSSFQMEDQLFMAEQNRYEARHKRRIYRQLSDACRKSFRQKYGQELSVKTMAEINEVAVQSVKNTLSRCYKKLRELILNDSEIMAIIKNNYGTV